MKTSTLHVLKKGIGFSDFQDGFFTLKGNVLKGKQSLVSWAGLVLTAVMMTFGLAACKKEDPAAQTQAFINVLQQNILNQQGLKIPALSKEQETEMGKDYVEQYNILYNFSHYEEANKSLKNALQTMQKMARANNPVTRQKVIDESLDAANNVISTFDEMVENAEKQKNLLKQSDELKAVYTQSFDKTIATPMKTAKSCILALKNLIDLSKQVNDLVIAHPNDLGYQGNQIVIKNQKYAKEVNKLLKDQQEAMTSLQSNITQMKDLLGPNKS